MKRMQYHVSRSPVLLLYVLLHCLLTPSVFSDSAPREILRNRFFNQPENRTAEWNLRTGGLGSFSCIPDPSSEEGGNILFVRVRQISEKPWSMELRQRIDVPILSQSVLKISFDYKITPGYIFHFYWQVETSPWPKLLSLRLNAPVNEWKHLSVTVPVHEGHPVDTTALSFHLAETPGELQLKNLSMTLLPPGTDPLKIPSTIPPVLGGDFYDKDWRNSIQQKIRLNRTGTVKISVTSNGVPVPNASVTCRQMKNDMLLGAETSAALLEPEILSLPALRNLHRRIQNSRKFLPEYRKNLLRQKKFDFISIYDAFVWKEYDLWGKNIAHRLMKDIRNAGLDIRIPALYIPAYMYCPVRCRNMSAEKLWETLFQHLTHVSGQYGPGASGIGVLHGAVKYSEIYHFIGVDSLPEAFHTVRKNSPGTPCLISSSDALGALSPVPLNDLLELIYWLKNQKIQIDGVILQADFNELNVAPQTMEKRLQQFAAAANLPIHIRNFSVNEEKDDVHADMIRDFLLLFYAEPDVVSLTLGEQWSPALLNPRLGYYNAEFRPRKAVSILDRLLYQEWRRDRKGITGADGCCTLELHHGLYNIQVLHRNRKISKIIHSKAISGKHLLFALP